LMSVGHELPQIDQTSTASAHPPPPLAEPQNLLARPLIADAPVSVGQHQQQAIQPVPIQQVRPTHDERLRNLINTHLSLSATQPNVALLVDAQMESAGSITDTLAGFLIEKSNVRLITNIGDAAALKVGGCFEAMYSGNGSLLAQVLQLSRVDYLLLGKA